MASQHNVTIKSGPSKWDLVLALFDRTPERRLDFIFWMDGEEDSRLVKGGQAVISSVEVSTLKEEFWHIHGLVRFQTAEDFYARKDKKPTSYHRKTNSVEFKALYSTKNREGVVYDWYPTD